MRLTTLSFLVILGISISTSAAGPGPAQLSLVEVLEKNITQLSPAGGAEEISIIQIIDNGNGAALIDKPITIRQLGLVRAPGFEETCRQMLGTVLGGFYH